MLGFRLGVGCTEAGHAREGFGCLLQGYRENPVSSPFRQLVRVESVKVRVDILFHIIICM